jgi:hypothetical protein
MMNKIVAMLLIASVITSGCAHTTANPVLLAQPGDDARSCDGIANEMQQMVQAQAVAESDRNKQVAGNVALGITGVFLIVPLFFMDTGNAATVEERAAKARYQRLNQMQIDKKCPATPYQATATSTPTETPGTVTTKPVVAAIETPKADTVLTPTQKLEALDAMLKKGLITQDEYNAKKQEILKNM